MVVIVVVIHLMVVITLVVVWVIWRAVIEQMTMEKDDNYGKSHVSNYSTKVRKTITDQLIAPAPIIILFYTSQSHPYITTTAESINIILTFSSLQP